MFIVIAFLMFFSYMLGSVFGELRAIHATNERLKNFLVALKKVSDLATLRGEDFSKLSDTELLDRIQKQLEVYDS